MRDLSLSIQAKLKNYSRSNGLDYVLISRLYMQEGLLRRVSLSSYSKSFYLKGGLLLYLISGFKSRATRDIDVLGKDVSSDSETLRRVMIEILSIEPNDSLKFNCDSIEFSDITEGAEYHGKRMKVQCFLGNMKTNLQVDIGFGDEIVPEPVEIDYPEILEKEGFKISVYSLESVIAEKFEAMIVLDTLNSRMKDFYDIYNILTEEKINLKVLEQAIGRTFKIRHTVLPDDPAVFSDNFSSDIRNINLWNAFLKRIKAENILFETVSDYTMPDCKKEKNESNQTKIDQLYS